MQTLQIQPGKLYDIVLQYGVLGMVAVALSYFAWHTYKQISKKTDEEYSRLLQRNEKLEKEVENLRQEMMQLIAEERDRMADLVRANTEALIDLRKTIVDYLLNHH